MADLFSILQMLGLGGQQQPAPQGQQIGNLAGAGFPGAQAMQQQNPVANAPTPPPASGLMGMLGGSQQPDPMMLAAQLGGMTPGTPQYAQTQQAMQAASAAQQKRAMSMGLLQTGLSTAAARDPLGYPAGAIQGLAQGVPAGMNVDDQMLNRARQTSQSLLGAQQAGQQMAGGSLDLQTKQRLMATYGVSEPQAIAAMMASKSAQGMQKALQDIVNDPKATPDAKARAQAGLAMGTAGMMGMTPDKFVSTYFAKPLDPTVAAKNMATTANLEARTAALPGHEAAYAEGMRNLGAYRGAAAGTAEAKTDIAKDAEAGKNADAAINALEGGAFVKALGTKVDRNEFKNTLKDPTLVPPEVAGAIPDGTAVKLNDPTTHAEQWWVKHGGTLFPLVGAPAGAPAGAKWFQVGGASSTEEGTP